MKSVQSGARDVVLGRMLVEGYISNEEREQARNEPLDLAERDDRSEELGAYFTEEIRRKLIEDYGTRLYESGLRVYTTLDSRLQAAAEQALDSGLRAVDKTQGWRGSKRNLLEEQIDIAAHIEQRWDRPIETGDYVPAVVLDSSREQAQLHVGPYTAVITPEGAAWTAFDRVENVRLERLIQPGDLISVHVTEVHNDGTLSVGLDQEPELEGGGARVRKTTPARSRRRLEVAGSRKVNLIALARQFGRLGRHSNRLFMRLHCSMAGQLAT